MGALSEEAENSLDSLNPQADPDTRVDDGLKDVSGDLLPRTRIPCNLEA